MKQTVKTSRAAGQLEKMFRALSTRFFDGKLPEPIKTFGTHEVPIKLHKEVTGKLAVKVVEA